MEEHEDILPIASQVEAGASEFVEFEIWHALGEFDGFFSILFDFGKWGLVFDARFEIVAEADFLADFGPIILFLLVEGSKTGLAGIFEEIIPDGANGIVVIVPEFAFVSSAVGGDGRVARVFWIGLAIFVKIIGETDFDENVVFCNVFLEIFFVFDYGVFEGKTIWTN